MFTFETPAQVAAATIARQRLWTDLRDERGPFDIIGDAHGCYDELVEAHVDTEHGPGAMGEVRMRAWAASTVGCPSRST